MNERLLNGTPASDSFLPPITLPLDANLWQAGVNPLLTGRTASAEGLRHGLHAVIGDFGRADASRMAAGSLTAAITTMPSRLPRPHARGSARHVRVSRRARPEWGHARSGIGPAGLRFAVVDSRDSGDRAMTNCWRADWRQLQLQELPEVARNSMADWWSLNEPRPPGMRQPWFAGQFHDMGRSGSEGAACQSACNFDPRIASPGMLLNKFPPMTGAASPNRVGVVDGGKDQHGRAARGGVGGGGALPVGQARGEGAHPR